MNPSSKFQICDLTMALPDELRRGVIAIGNFDGVHRGHQVVLEKAMQQASDLNAPCLALSFEPHPKTLFRPDTPIFRLTPEAMKARVLGCFGLNGLAILPFTKEIAATTAHDFVTDFLVQKAGAAHVVTGFNFHFGKGREGSPQFLQSSGKEFGFGVTIIEAHKDDDAQTVSSSRVRDCLTEGDIETASGLLGYRWCATGKVIKGAQLGRTLGYPTANIELPSSCTLAHGIYAVRLRRANGDLHKGVASYGRRPTFDNGRELLETFVFDFNDDLYGEEIEISLFARLRGEEKFDSTDALIAQMDRDSEQAAAILASAIPLSDLDKRLIFSGVKA